MKKQIRLKNLGLTISFKNLDKYFKLIEDIQKSESQDTYLLMDNLYEPNASCIDTYSLFKYLKQNNYNVKYVLYKKNPLYKILKDKNDLEDIIVTSESSMEERELYEKLFFVLPKTKYIILSFPDSLPSRLMEFAYQNNSMSVVGIGHGPVFFKTSILNTPKSNYLSPDRYNLYLVSSQKEKDLFLQAGWPEQKLINIGLPRFDWCKNIPHKEKNIVIMFTWRLDTFRNSQNIKDLQYFKSLQSLLNNKKLQNIARLKGYNVIIALHHSVRDLCGLDVVIPDCYKIAETSALINYINTADLFITDYSSIVHDFMFLNKPVIFYRLDYGDPLLSELDSIDLEESKAKDEQVFNVFYDETELIDKIEYYKSNNFQLEKEYLEKENAFFTEKENICEKLTITLENYKPLKCTIAPIWKDIKTALCVSSSNEYVPYLCVYLKSVIENCSQKKDIIIFERDISDENKDRLIKYLENKDTSIRFVNPSPLFKDANLYVSHDYFKEECYYRIAAPKLLDKYDKIIFTDLDLIVTDNIWDLANIDMNGSPIAACIEPIWKELYLRCVKIFDTDIRHYTSAVLNLSSPFEYYNTGVVVFDVKEYNKLSSFEKLLEIINKNDLLYQEQCALNILFKDNFCTLPNVWNYELAPSLLSNGYHFEFYKTYKKFEKTAKILHYLGRYKPWKNPMEYKAELWWEYARKTPFYELILKRMMESVVWGATGHVDYKLNILKNYKKICLKYWKYKILRNFVFGKTKDRYIAKKRKFKEQIRALKGYK